MQRNYKKVTAKPRVRPMLMNIKLLSREKNMMVNLKVIKDV